ncbi:MAG: rhodanese-like domain-containing protein [Dehalococcoidales bacterium]
MNIRRFAIIFALLLITTLVYGFTSQTGSSNQILEDIGVQEAFELIQSNQGNPDFVIVDIRTPEEFNEGHIENSVNTDFYSETFREELDKFDKSKTYFIYCRSGNRSGRAMPVMKELGFQEVYNLSAGIKEWIAEGLLALPSVSSKSKQN